MRTELRLTILALQLSFQMWTNQMQDTLNSKKHGDTAFRAKDFATAIDSYTQVSPLYTTLKSLMLVLEATNSITAY